MRSGIHQLYEGVFHLIHERGLANILGPENDPTVQDHLVERSNSLVIAEHLPPFMRNMLRDVSGDKGGLEDVAWRLGNIRDGVVLAGATDDTFGIIVADETVYIRRKVV